MNHRLLTRAEALEAAARRIEADAAYADGQAYSRAESLAAELAAEATRMRQAATATGPAFRVVLMVPERTPSYWRQSAESLATQMERAGNAAGAAAIRSQQANRERIDPAVYGDRIVWKEIA